MYVGKLPRHFMSFFCLYLNVQVKIFRKEKTFKTLPELAGSSFNLFRHFKDFGLKIKSVSFSRGNGPTAPLVRCPVKIF